MNYKDFIKYQIKDPNFVSTKVVFVEKETEVFDARIVHTTLYLHSFGRLTSELAITCDNGLDLCLIGLNLYTEPENVRDPSYFTDNGGFIISRLLRVGGAESWEDMVGQRIRVKIVNRYLKSIGHITDDIWFGPDCDISQDNPRIYGHLPIEDLTIRAGSRLAESIIAGSNMEVVA
jgi:hypothetical protein